MGRTALIAYLEEMRGANLQGFGVVVVGAGFAGLELALRLSGTGVKTLLIESGREEIEEPYQKLLVQDAFGRRLSGKHNFNPHLPSDIADIGRVRALGGGSTIWSGRWKRLDGEDFREKAWVPHSGWPISEEDIAPYYRGVEQDFGLCAFDEFESALHKRMAWLNGSGLKPTLRFDQKGGPTRLRERYSQRLRTDLNLLVVLGATATEIELDGDNRNVTGVIVRPITGEFRLSLKGKIFILACGGIETPRLLLASNSQMRGGVGNQHDMVGRFYMDHPKLQVGRLRLGKRGRGAEELLPKGNGAAFGVGMSLQPDVQAAGQILNESVFLTHVEQSRPPRSLLQRLVRRVPGRLQRRPLWRSILYLEQAPNPESRILLSQRRDVLGVPGIALNWRFTEIDQRSLIYFVHRLSELTRRCGLGEYECDVAELNLDEASTANHPMGTTRMAAHPRAGVVDRNCLVFGTSNLFIVGSSVFSTGGNANPNYTIVCFARRLADHIGSVVKGRV